MNVSGEGRYERDRKVEKGEERGQHAQEKASGEGVGVRENTAISRGYVGV